jgi:hypothetical protein
MPEPGCPIRTGTRPHRTDDSLATCNGAPPKKRLVDSLSYLLVPRQREQVVGVAVVGNCPKIRRVCVDHTDLDGSIVTCDVHPVAFSQPLDGPGYS